MGLSANPTPIRTAIVILAAAGVRGREHLDANAYDRFRLLGVPVTAALGDRAQPMFGGPWRGLSTLGT